MLSRDEIQRLLPEGILLEQQRNIPDCHGSMYDCSDNRLSSDQQIRRCVRIIEVSRDAPWRVQWIESLQRIASLNTSGVCRPLEMGTLDDRHFYLVFDRFPAVLADHIPATGLVNSRLAWSIMGQLITALAELHRADFAHGDLRAENIYLDTPTLTEDTRVWIGHVELANLPQWTSGEIMDSRMLDIFPPEWNGQLGKASPPADVYALGLVAVELFAGRGAGLSLSSPESGATRKLICLDHRVRWWRRNWLVKPMLAETKLRLKDGVAVHERQKWIQRAESVIRIILIPAITAVFAITILGLRISQLNEESEASRGKIATLEKDVGNEKQRNERNEVEADGLRSRLEKARGGVKPDPEVDPTPKSELTSSEVQLQAQKLWTQKFEYPKQQDFDRILKSIVPPPSQPVRKFLDKWQEVIVDAWDGCNFGFTEDQKKPEAKKTRRELAYFNLKGSPWSEAVKTELVKSIWRDQITPYTTTEKKLQSIELRCQKLSLKNWVRPKLQGYFHQLKNRNAFWIRWQSQPEKLTQVWKDRVNEPWSETAQLREIEKLKAMEAAEKKWREVVGRGDLTWDRFKEDLYVAVGDDPEAQKVISIWIDQYNRFAAGEIATIILRKGHSPPGSGVYRAIDVHVAGSYWPVDDEKIGQNWETEADYNYPALTELSFPWQPGKSIQIKVYGERQTLRIGLRPPYIDKTIAGPVALWQLAQEGKLTAKAGEDEHSLEFKVKNCPGPPPLARELEKARAMIP